MSIREKARGGGLVVQATAGTRVVILGWDIDDSLKADLLGFAIQRVDHTENETYWLRGMKTFPNTNPPLPLGGNASSREQPFQTFQWGDYSAKPDHQYTYTITAMSGQPGALVAGASLSVDIATEAEDGGIHSIYFNRGAIASQDTRGASRTNRQTRWARPLIPGLSRGLLEAIKRFIGKASDRSYSLRVAIYEFQWPAVLDALHDAAGRGVNVNVIFDAIKIQPKSPYQK